MSIKVENLSRNFGGFQAVDRVSFHLETGGLAALLGPSGSGKSTLLRMIAGLEKPDTGSIRLTGQESSLMSARDRNVGFVFQHYALFKHMTVWDNIAFGLAVRKRPEPEIRERVDELLEVVQLKGLEKRYPDQLSGGQRQRVAVARTLAPRPGVLLLDEPFGALDAKVRSELRSWMRELHEKTQVTTLFVTHDQHEALDIADRIFVMNQGRLEQEGSPLEIFDHPATPFVAEFVGETNFVEGEICAPQTVCWGPFRFPVKEPAPKGSFRIYFRPNDVYVSSGAGPGLVPGRINSARFRGPLIELEIGVEGNRRLLAQVPKGVALASDFRESRQVYVEITAFHVFPT